MLDLVEDGSTWDEVIELAKKIEAAGATIINTELAGMKLDTNHRNDGRGGFSGSPTALWVK